MFKRKKTPESTEKKMVFHKRDPKTPVIKNVIAVASGKGGVGKSTVTSHLAVGLAKAGYNVAVIDADIYGPSQPRLFGITDAKSHIGEDDKIQPIKAHGVHVISAPMLLASETAIIWRAPMATKLVRDFLTRVAWPDLDYLLIDLPPGTGDIQITLAQQAKLTGAVIVTTPQQVAFNIAEKAMQMFQKVNIPILGIVENMSGFICENCQHENHIFSQGGADRLAEKYQTQVLAHIPLEAEIVNCGDAGKTLFDTSVSSKACVAYNDMVQRLPKIIAESKEKLLEPVFVGMENKLLKITWHDGVTKYLNAYALRISCSCALCIDEHTGQQLLDPASVLHDIQITQYSPVGRYGLKICFSDGHNTGIFTFEKLKALNSDDLCAAQNTKETVAASEPLSLQAVQTVLDKNINPQVGQHGGRIELQAVKDGVVYVKMSGGCQGCSQASQTLKNGVWRLLKQHFPEVKELVDVTEHAAGKTPYFQ